MPELTQKERLQPSLLDRLTDDEPDKKREIRDRWVLTLQQLRAAVLRDLSWLLNTDNLHVKDLALYPHVERSVLNYGFPDLSGLTATNVNAVELTRVVREVIRNFEPLGAPVKEYEEFEFFDLSSDPEESVNAAAQSAKFAE